MAPGALLIAALVASAPAPLPRPPAEAPGTASAAAAQAAETAMLGHEEALAPPPRPQGLAPPRSTAPAPADAAVIPAMVPATRPFETMGPIVCQDRRLEGRARQPIVQAGGACGIAAPVVITRVAGVALSHPATLDCHTAVRTAHLVDSIMQPAARRHLGSSIARLRVMGSFVCRTRNHKPGARISEHGLGRAIDIGGVTLADGRRITVEDDYGRGAGGRFLAEVRQKSCGLFTTVLGPGSDAHHDAHFHLDTADRQSLYCK